MLCGLNSYFGAATLGSCGASSVGRYGVEKLLIHPFVCLFNYNVFNKKTEGNIKNHPGCNKASVEFGVSPFMFGLLSWQQKIYKILSDGIGIPQVHWFGRHK